MEVYKAIAQVTAAMGREGISKDRTNSGQGYKFRGIDDIYNALNTQLSAAQLCIIPRIVEREIVERQTAKGGTLFYVTVKAEYDLVSAKDGSKHTACVYGEAMDSADKATNKAMSAAYKYMAFMLFCIPTEGDNDADGTTHDVAPRAASYSKPTPKPAAPIERLPDRTDERDSLIAAIKAIAPAAKALGVAFPTTAPKDMTLADLHGLLDICQAATDEVLLGID